VVHLWTLSKCPLATTHSPQALTHPTTRLNVPPAITVPLVATRPLPAQQVSSVQTETEWMLIVVVSALLELTATQLEPLVPLYATRATSAQKAQLSHSLAPEELTIRLQASTTHVGVQPVTLDITVHIWAKIRCTRPTTSAMLATTVSQALRAPSPPIRRLARAALLEVSANREQRRQKLAFQDNTAPT
jgi:hypothetical protein